MAIFQREASDQPQPAPGHSRGAVAPAEKQTTVVAAGSRIQGEISGGTDVMIHGRVEGQLVLGNSVIVGEGGEVQGQIEARRVQVGGKVHGDIRASERIEVLQSGRIEGDVSAPRVAINAGAFFKGKVEMTAEGGGQQSAEPKGKAAANPTGGAAPAGPSGGSKAAAAESR